MKTVILFAILRSLGGHHTVTKVHHAEQLTYLIQAAAYENGLDPLLVAAVAKHESGFDVNAVGPDGEDEGLMQLRGGPGTAFAKLSRRQLRDPRTNARLGAWFLALKVAKCGTLPKALGAYNSGRCRVTRYSHRVLTEYEEMKRAQAARQQS